MTNPNLRTLIPAVNADVHPIPGAALTWDPVEGVYQPTLAPGAPIMAALGNDNSGLPYAATLSVGQQFIATDCLCILQVAPRQNALNTKNWLQTSTPQRKVIANAVGVATATRLGVYDPVLGTFTQASVSGQACNAACLVGAGAGAPCVIHVNPAISVLFTPAAFIAAGGPFMTNAAGFPIPFVAGGGNVELGISPVPVGPGTLITTVIGLIFWQS